MTEAERLLWARVRRKQLKGIQFYRQKPLGNYIVDFYAPAANLVIEVDGAEHFSPDGKEYDAHRDLYLQSMGLTVLRFPNSQVLNNIEGVIKKINEHL